MYAGYLTDELHECFVVKVEVAVMLLQHIVEKQVQWPVGEVGSAAGSNLFPVELCQHIVGVESFLLAGCLQCVGAVAAVVDAHLLKCLCTIEILGYDGADRHVLCQFAVHNRISFNCYLFTCLYDFTDLVAKVIPRWHRAGNATAIGNKCDPCPAMWFT